MNTKQAKDFFVEQAVEQAALDSIPLSDVEKKMMYFTESDPSSCDNPIELNDEFEAEYETKEYETKISRLLHHANKRLRKENPEQARIWDHATRTLRKGDHYLLVLVDQSSTADLGSWTPFLWGVGIAILIFIFMAIKIALDERGLIPRWVFGWISDEPRTAGLELSLVFCACVGLWLIVKLARLGALKDVTKTFVGVLLSTFPFLRPKGPSRR